MGNREAKNGQARKIIWHMPKVTESGERKDRRSKLRSHLALLYYPSAPAKPFPKNGQARKIIWEKPTVTESGEIKQRIWKLRSHLISNIKNNAINRRGEI